MRMSDHPGTWPSPCGTSSVVRRMLRGAACPRTPGNNVAGYGQAKRGRAHRGSGGHRGYADPRAISPGAADGWPHRRRSVVGSPTRGQHAPGPGSCGLMVNNSRDAVGLASIAQGGRAPGRCRRRSLQRGHGEQLPRGWACADRSIPNPHRRRRDSGGRGAECAIVAINPEHRETLTISYTHRRDSCKRSADDWCLGLQILNWLRLDAIGMEHWKRWIAKSSTKS